MIKLFIVLSILLSQSAFSANVSECKDALRKFNSKFSKTTEWGIDKKSMTLVVRFIKGHKASVSEDAEGSKVKRLCISAGLPINYYQAIKGSNQTFALCHITNGKNLSKICDPQVSTIDFQIP